MQQKKTRNRWHAVRHTLWHWALLGILAFLLATSSSVIALLTPVLGTTGAVAWPRKAGLASSQSPTLTGAGTSPTPAPGTPSIAPGDWTSYLLNNGGYNEFESIINPATASQLTLYWSHHAGGAITSQPVEVNGIIYWGSWDGYEHATGLDGRRMWSTYLGMTIDDDPNCDPQEVGVTSTATVAPLTINGTTRLVVFVGGGDANFYALDAADGHVLWSTSLGSSPATFLWSSPALYNGSIYMGVSSFGDCPLIQGQLVQMDAASGQIQHIFTTVPAGCVGASVWGSPTIDRNAGTLYFATGNGGACDAAEDYAEALIELNAADLSLVDFWQMPQATQFDDSDFGATPTLFTASIHGVTRSLVGVMNKNGIYYAFLRSTLSQGPLWSDQIAYAPYCPGCEGPGTMAPSAWDGSRLYVGGASTTIKGRSCGGSLRALNPATGAFLWEDCLPVWRVIGAVTVVPGVVVVVEGEFVFAVNATTGAVLYTFKDAGASSTFDGSPSIAHGMLFVGNFDGTLYAFGVVKRLQKRGIQGRDSAEQRSTPFLRS